MPLRLDTSIQASTASRFSDVANLKLSNMAVTPLDSVGPDHADVVTGYSAEGKHLAAGSIEKHSVVRHIDVDCCPVSAIGTPPFLPQNLLQCIPASRPSCALIPGVVGAANAVIWDLHHPGRLYAEVIARVHLLKAPTGSGDFNVAYSSLRDHMKPKMLAAGLQCDAVAYKGGKSRVTHSQEVPGGGDHAQERHLLLERQHGGQARPLRHPPGVPEAQRP